MRKTKSFLFLFLCLGLVAHAANFTASLDRDSIPLGESATLSLILEGGQPQNAPTPNVPGLEIVSTGNSQNISSLNGQMNSTVTVTYSITPQRTGAFVIPAMTAEIDGHQLSSQPSRLSVPKVDATSATAVNSNSEIVFMKLSLPKQSIYVGQMLTAQLQLCGRDDERNFGNYQLTSEPVDGLTVGKMAQGQNQSAQIGNRVYTAIPLAFALTAMKSGTWRLGPFTASATYMIPSDNNQGSDTFFRQIFNQGEQKQVALATGTLEMKSLPLAANNVPVDFNGAVGDFTMTATAADKPHRGRSHH